MQQTWLSAPRHNLYTHRRSPITYPHPPPPPHTHPATHPFPPKKNLTPGDWEMLAGIRNYVNISQCYLSTLWLFFRLFSYWNGLWESCAGCWRVQLSILFPNPQTKPAHLIRGSQWPRTLLAESGGRQTSKIRLHNTGCLHNDWICGHQSARVTGGYLEWWTARSKLGCVAALLGWVGGGGGGGGGEGLGRRATMQARSKLVTDIVK